MSELGRLGVHLAEAEAVPVPCEEDEELLGVGSDSVGGNVDDGHRTPSAIDGPEAGVRGSRIPASTTGNPVEGELVVEGKRVRNAKVCGREVNHRGLVLGGIAAIIVLLVVVIAVLLTRKGAVGDDPLEIYTYLGPGECVDSSGEKYDKVVKAALWGEDETLPDAETKCLEYCARFADVPGHVGLGIQMLSGACREFWFSLDRGLPLVVLSC